MVRANQADEEAREAAECRPAHHREAHAAQPPLQHVVDHERDEHEEKRALDCTRLSALPQVVFRSGTKIYRVPAAAAAVFGPVMALIFASRWFMSSPVSIFPST